MTKTTNGVRLWQTIAGITSALCIAAVVALVSETYATSQRVTTLEAHYADITKGMERIEKKIDDHAAFDVRPRVQGGAAVVAKGAHVGGQS